MKKITEITLTIALASQAIFTSSLEASASFKALWGLPLSCLMMLTSTSCVSSDSSELPSFLEQESAVKGIETIAKRDAAYIQIDLAQEATQATSTKPLTDDYLNRIFSPSSNDPFAISTSYKGFEQRSWFHEAANNKGLYIELPKDEYGTNATGVSAKIPYDISAEAIHLSTEVSVDGARYQNNELLFGKMGKLMGVCIAKCATGKSPSNGSNGASVRVSYRKTGKDLGIFIYMYHLGQREGYGTYAPAPYKKAIQGLSKLDVKMPAVNPVMKLGLEHTNKIDLFVELNSPGKANGSASLFLNDQFVVQVDGVRFRNNSEDTFSGLAMDVFQGGGSEYTMDIKGGFLIQKITLLKN